MPAFTVTGVDSTTDKLTATGVATTGGSPGTVLVTGDRFRLRNVGGALPAATPALAAVTDYFAIRIDDNHIKIATSSANAIAGTAVDLTTGGSGTLFIEFGLPYSVPRVLAAGSQVLSSDLNSSWNAQVSLYDLLTGQTQNVWSTVSFAATFNMAGPLFMTGVITPPAITDSAVYTAYNPTGLSTANLIRQSVTGTNVPTIGGIVGGVDGRMIWIQCTSGSVNDKIGIAHQNVTSAAADRITCPNATGITFPQNGSACLIYDGSIPMWRVLSTNI